MAVFFQNIESLCVTGYMTWFLLCYRFMATSSQIARTALCAFRTGGIFASVMLNDFFMATFFQIIEAALFQNVTK
jgi:hypothetical protein